MNTEPTAKPASAEERAELIRILREPFDRNPYTLPELCAVTADMLEADADLERQLGELAANLETADRAVARNAELERQLSEQQRVNEELRKLVLRYVASYPAFRSKPLGAPNSFARIEQDERCAMEDLARHLVEEPTAP